MLPISYFNHNYVQGLTKQGGQVLYVPEELVILRNQIRNQQEYQKNDSVNNFNSNKYNRFINNNDAMNKNENTKNTINVTPICIYIYTYPSMASMQSDQ